MCGLTNLYLYFVSPQIAILLAIEKLHKVTMLHNNRIAHHAGRDRGYPPRRSGSTAPFLEIGSIFDVVPVLDERTIDFQPLFKRRLRVIAKELLCLRYR